MAYDYSKHYATDLDEIIPTAAMIKNIPLNWKTGHLLHLMNQMRLPSPSALNYLYDNFDFFRGMAFADFASPDEARLVIQQLNYHRVSGGKLNVQYKRKRRETIVREDASRRIPLQPQYCAHTDVRDKPYMHPQTKVSSAPRPTRQQTPPSEIFELLMGYQTYPVEKQKLRRLLEQTGDYQEAVDEFAKNRVWESQEEGYRWSMKNGKILEMRPATPGELHQIADMESWFGIGGEASSSGSLMVKHEREQDVTNMKKDRILESINLASLEKEHEITFAEQDAEVDEGTDIKGVEKGRVKDGDEKQEGIYTGANEKRR